MMEHGLAYHCFWVFYFGTWAGIVLLVLFHFVTVRRLRTNPQTRDRLSMPLLPGWEAQRVASAITMPRAFTRWVRQGAAGDLFADCDAIYQHTSRAERCLGRASYAMLLGSPALLFVCYVVDRLRVILAGA